MNKILTIFSIFIFSLSASATDDIYKILFINTPSIKIGGKNLTKGDEFASSAIINWSSNKQAMRVVSLSTNRQIVLTPKAASGKKTLASYLKAEKNLSTRPGFPASIPALRQVIPANIQLLDRYEISTSVPIDSERFFFASYIKDGETINKKLPSLPNEGFYIDRTLWEIDGVSYPPSSTVVSIHYYDVPSNKIIDVVSNLLIEPLDEKIN